MSGCGYQNSDWECREGGYLWDAGTGEGWDPDDLTHICPNCQTFDYLEAAKEEAESCSSWSDCGRHGTGLDIWVAAERRALVVNEKEARAALLELGAVEALVGDGSPEGYHIVMCNTQPVEVTP